MINKLHQGDNLEIMQLLEDDSIDLIYLDPPFFSQKNYKKDSFGFSDTWKDKDEFKNYMLIRLQEMKRTMKDDANILLHCDTSSNYIFRELLNEVFGEDNFRSEIIWYFKKWSNSKKGLIKNYQTIYWFSKTKDYKFNPLLKEYSKNTNIEQILQKRTKKDGVTEYLKENDEVVQADAKKGVPLSDVWEIPFLNPRAKERCSYPTQKPIELLKRIISLYSNEGDVVLDPFCGSATTCVTAKILKRKFIGIDVSEEAIKVGNIRLKKPIESSSLIKKESKEDILSKFISKDLYTKANGKYIDGLLKDKVQDGFVFIKVQKENEKIQDLIDGLLKYMSKKNSFKSFIIQTQGDSYVDCDKITILKDLNLKIKGNK